MRCSVIMPTLGDRDRLWATLTALGRQEAAPGSQEVIVVVDRPDPATVAWIASLPLGLPVQVLMNDSNQGAAATRNRGLQAARGDVVVFVDDDCVCAPGFLAAHLAQHQPGAETVVLGRIRHIPAEACPALLDRIRQAGTDPAAWPVMLEKAVREDAYANLSARIFACPEPGPAAWVGLTCGNASAPRGTLLQVGAFDPGFVGWGPEDVELGFRLHRAGARFVYAPEAAVYHLDHFKDFGQMARSSARNLKYLAGKYPGDAAMALYLKFVGSAISLQEFCWRLAGAAGPLPADPGCVFRPLQYLSAKARLESAGGDGPNEGETT